ncbi:helix-turn-helix transcriptional regulator [Streptococcus sp. HMSC070B10]|uniref:helix-turn-helix transcriptional regulator n=1 Tax=Streptococcus sp. HMSC070B10 TaxID=1715092 RepID=UPI0008A4B6F2|nr:helix-turn-helix transcriptional regulator [Streptococcus sp. HMSC070B10]OFO01902.1 transcriptional regulator [Streptococcus sp. HMSC070B10]
MRKQTQNRIRELRKKARLSQQTLADQIGVFRNTISNWETGYSQISLENAKNVAEYFGVTIDYLLGSESDQT